MPSLGAVPAAYAGIVPGGGFAAGAAVRGSARGVCVCERAQPARGGTVYPRYAGEGAPTREKPGGYALLHVYQGDHRDTEAAARRKYEEFFEQISYEGALALLSGWAGIDFGQFAPEQPLEYIETNAVRTLMRAFTEDPRRKWTLRDLAKFVGIGGGGPVLVGAPEQLAAAFQE